MTKGDFVEKLNKAEEIEPKKVEEGKTEKEQIQGHPNEDIKREVDYLRETVMEDPPGWKLISRMAFDIEANKEIEWFDTFDMIKVNFKFINSDAEASWYVLLRLNKIEAANYSEVIHAGNGVFDTSAGQTYIKLGEFETNGSQLVGTLLITGKSASNKKTIKANIMNAIGKDSLLYGELASDSQDLTHILFRSAQYYFSGEVKIYGKNI